MIPVNVRFIWPSVFRGKDVQKSTNKKQELFMPATFVYGSGRNA